MIKNILHPLMAVVLAAGIASASVQEAQAGRGAGVAAGIAAGIIGLGIIGAAAEARHRDRYYDEGPECYRGPRRCGWENRRCFENRYGDEVCRGGEWICRRPLICD